MDTSKRDIPLEIGGNGGEMSDLYKNRNFLWLFSGQFVSQIGNSLFMIALPWFVYTQTGSKGALAITGFAQTLPGAAALFAGVFVDRWSKRRTMIASDAARFLLALGLFFLAIFHSSLIYIVIAVFILQLVGTFFNPAAGALTPLVVERDLIASAMGLEQSSSATAMLLGQIGGGTLLTAFGAPTLFWLDAFTFIVSVTSLGFVRVREPAPVRDTKSSFFSEWKDGLVQIGQSKMVLLVIAAALLSNFGFAAFDIVLTAWVKGPLHSNALGLGLSGAAFFVGMILGGLLLGTISKKVAIRQVLLVGFILSGLFIGLIAAVPNLYWDMGTLFLAGINNGLLNGSLSAKAIEIIPEEMRGRIFGTLQAMMTLATPLGMAVFGALMLYLRLGALILLMAAISLIAGLLFLLPIRDDSENLKGGADPSANAGGTGVSS